MIKRKAVLRLLMAISLFLIAVSTKAYALPEISRLAGSDRYSTAIEISKSGWVDGSSEYAILATGEDFPDALCAAPLARKLNAPILLTGMSGLDKRVQDELLRLSVKNVYIIGGESVMPFEVEYALEAMGTKCTRIAGADRYETPIEIAKLLGNFDEIVVVSDSNFPDVLSIAPIAAKKCIPIILSPKDALPENVAEYLNSKNIRKSYVIGGVEVISNIVAQQVPGSFQRLSGQDRYETNTAIIKEFGTQLNFNTIYIATGTNFPDALAGSSVAPITSSPIVLVDSVPAVATKNFISLKIDSIANMKVLGGEGAVTTSTLQELVNINSGDKYNDFSLRYSANYKTKVYNNVSWVPANALGKPKLTKEQIISLGRNPETLQSNINTLYDVIQYIRASDFKSSDDSIHIEENSFDWIHHKPSNKGIITNEGSYATMSNLVNYLLKGNYEESGFIHYFQQDGTEYVLNYMKYNGKYYVVDFTHYKNDFRYTAVETGNLKDYYSSDYIAGNVHETATLQDYIKYCTEKFNDPPELWTSYVSDNVLPVAVKKVNSVMTVYFPKNMKNAVKILYDAPDDNLKVDFTDGPTLYPSWI